jgi:hypothetical protein
MINNYETLRKIVYASKKQAYKEALDQIWIEDPNYEVVLDAIEPAALGAFSHQFPTIHVPKEHEYLHRLLTKVPNDLQLDFLRRYIEYLVWSPKYLIDASNSQTSGLQTIQDPRIGFLNSAENSKAIRALFYINEIANNKLIDATKLLLQIGCTDVSQAIGHYFSCTESLIKLAERAGQPQAKTHLLTSTLFLMQSRPINLREPKEPSIDLEDILSTLIRKTGFAEYHYMIVLNGLIKHRDFLGEKYYLNGLAGIENLLPGLRDGVSEEYLKKVIGNTKPDIVTVGSLKRAIWRGDKSKAFAIMKAYLEEYGGTEELKQGILHSYTLINDHPHDPHYVTVPVSIFELIDKLRADEGELAFNHTVEFAVNRIKSRGVMKSH